MINYDDQTGSTASVTSGLGEYSNRTIYIHRNAKSALRSERFKHLLNAVIELEVFLSYEFLDIEFAINSKMDIYLLQVRKITTQPNWNRAIIHRIDAELSGIQSFVRTKFRAIQGIYGKTTVFGQMPDWNPAEMIGKAPRALAVSLYRNLITNNEWRTAREKMGYQSPKSQPLLVSLAGQPFIDTRLSFHSFLPAGLEKEICEKLVNTWVGRLASNPELHDKIEFDVAITAYSFDLDSRFENILGQALSSEEKSIYKRHLKNHTFPLITGEGPGSLQEALTKLEQINHASLDEDSAEMSSLFSLLEKCKHYGTEPFAILARHGFIAQLLLKSLSEIKILSEEDVLLFQGSVRTVASELVDDMSLLQLGKLSIETFMKNYGHLRPNSYDILSPRYDEMSELFSIGSRAKIKTQKTKRAFKLSADKTTAINSLLKKEGLQQFNAQDLFKYCNDAIAGRERGKFTFTRILSKILQTIAICGESHGLSREEMSHVPVESLLNIVLNSSTNSIETELRRVSDANAERHILTTAIRLPQVLFDEAGIHIVPFQVSQPNFVTNLDVTGQLAVLSATENAKKLDGKIVIIENADPGYDWIFAYDIAGLVTKYGGANSHMAIRCAEFGIPAAIGCGEQRYRSLLKAEQVNLNCAAGIIAPLY